MPLNIFRKAEEAFFSLTEKQTVCSSIKMFLMHL